MRRVSVGVGCAAFVAFAMGACGKVDPGDGAVEDAGAAAADVDARGYGPDSSRVPLDAGAVVPYGDDASPPDAGPPPSTACLDAGVACPLPASECLDVRWLRYYTGGACDADSGACRFVAQTLDCAASGTMCTGGGCQTVIVR